ncbi:MAG: ATP--guanido phosphotransferase [Armatimonadetes bacterium]|nr:ATP--guanido phosphotransferase [Armatimonadota bacterium]
MEPHTTGETWPRTDEPWGRWEGASALWTGGQGESCDIVLSTRARLARNLSDVPFPGRAAASELARVQQAALDLASDQNGGPLCALPVGTLSGRERERLVAQRLISPGFAQAAPFRCLLLDSERAVSVMVNEEDHFRIQCLLPGWQPETAWERAAGMAARLDRREKTAFNRRFGYLTASPGNMGTGLRLSAMAHLPALSQCGRMEPLAESALEIGVAIRGLFGEGTRPLGDLFQVSNALSLGITESEILGRVRSVVSKVIDQERQARRAVLYRWEEPLREAVGCSLESLPGLLRQEGPAVWEAMSLARLGIALGMAGGIDYRQWNLWLVEIKARLSDIETGFFTDNSITI